VALLDEATSALDSETEARLAVDGGVIQFTRRLACFVWKIALDRYEAVST
jgi:hypothetical protein